MSQVLAHTSFHCETGYVQRMLREYYKVMQKHVYDNLLQNKDEVIDLLLEVWVL
jgi:hypothetical protein